MNETYLLKIEFPKYLEKGMLVIEKYKITF